MTSCLGLVHPNAKTWADDTIVIMSQAAKRFQILRYLYGTKVGKLVWVMFVFSTISFDETLTR